MSLYLAKGYVSATDQPLVTSLMFPDGVRRLGEQLAAARVGYRALHYFPRAGWKSHFDRLWRPVLSDENRLRALARLMWRSADESDVSLHANVLRTALGSSLRDGTYGSELCDLFTGSRSLESALLPVLQSWFPSHNPFLEHVRSELCQIRGNEPSGAREYNYELELLRCAINRDFTIAKCVYLPPPHTTYYTSALARSKMEWLLQSMRAARHLPNFSFAWLPFRITALEAQSVTAVIMSVNGAAPVGENWSRDACPEEEILLGFAEKNNEGNAMWLHAEPAHARGEHTDPHSGLISLLRKIIHPLVRRMCRDFPLSVGKSVHCGNVRQLLDLCLSDEDRWVVWDSAKAHVAILSEGCPGCETVGTTTITSRALADAFAWMIPDKLNRGLFDEEGNMKRATAAGPVIDGMFSDMTVTDGLALSWVREDYAALASRLLQGRGQPA